MKASSTSTKELFMKAGSTYHNAERSLIQRCYVKLANGNDNQSSSSFISFTSLQYFNFGVNALLSYIRNIDALGLEKRE